MARTDITDYTARDLADGVYLHDHSPNHDGAVQLARELIGWAQERYDSSQRDLDVTTDNEAAAEYVGRLEYLHELLELLTTTPTVQPDEHVFYGSPRSGTSLPLSEYADHDPCAPLDAPTRCTVGFPGMPLLCTRPSGHDGPHEAAVDPADTYPHVCARWT